MSSPAASQRRCDGTAAGDVRARKPPVRAAYHVHSPFSYDCSTPLDLIIESAVRAGIRCLCVTDHDTIDGALALQAIAPPDLEVVVGCEFTVDDGSHVIGLGLTEMIAAKQVPDLFDRIKAQGGLVMLPHPFRRSSGIFRAEMRRHPDFVERVVAAADLVECFNGGDNFEHNASNLALARRSGIAAVASSDAHTAAAIGSVFVEYADPDFIHGRSTRGIFFGAQRPSREHPLKKRLMELYHAREGALPGPVTAAYRVAKRSVGRTASRRPAGPPELQYRLSTEPPPPAHDA